MSDWILFPSAPQKSLPNPAEDIIMFRKRYNVLAIGGDSIVVTLPDPKDDDEKKSHADQRERLLPYVVAIHNALRAEVGR